MYALLSTCISITASAFFYLAPSLAVACGFLFALASINMDMRVKPVSWINQISQWLIGIFFETLIKLIHIKVIFRIRLVHITDIELAEKTCGWVSKLINWNWVFNKTPVCKVKVEKPVRPLFCANYSSGKSLAPAIVIAASAPLLPTVRSSCEFPCPKSLNWKNWFKLLKQTLHRLDSEILLGLKFDC